MILRGRSTIYQGQFTMHTSGLSTNDKCWNHGRRWLKVVASLAIIVFVLSYLHSGFNPSSSKDSPGFLSTVTALQPLKQPSKAIIATTLQRNANNADWIVDLLPDWQPYIFVADGSVSDALVLSNQHAPKIPLALNRGREAASYLSYIITHYYNLPEYMVFIHGDRYQTHNGNDSLP